MYLPLCILGKEDPATVALFAGGIDTMEQLRANRQSRSLTREHQGPYAGETVDIEVAPDSNDVLRLADLSTDVLPDTRPETRQVGQIEKPVRVAGCLAEASPIKWQPVRYFRGEALPEEIKLRKRIYQFLHQFFLFSNPVRQFRVRSAQPWPQERRKSWLQKPGSGKFLPVHERQASRNLPPTLHDHLVPLARSHSI